jgi:hypothetical protein
VLKAVANGSVHPFGLAIDGLRQGGVCMQILKGIGTEAGGVIFMVTMK